MRRALVVTPVTLLLIPGVAIAAFQRTTAAQAMTLATLAVSPVSGVQVTASCGPTLSLTAKVTLTWTATSTSRATGYEIRRRVIPLAATAVGSAATATTGYADGPLPVGTAYGYVVRTYAGSWYADSAEVQVTTPAVCS